MFLHASKLVQVYKLIELVYKVMSCQFPKMALTTVYIRIETIIPSQTASVGSFSVICVYAGYRHIQLLGLG